jgi:outer membrane protein assembly factor BamE (lipoprotein component of BamABCDE complex)
MIASGRVDEVFCIHSMEDKLMYAFRFARPLLAFAVCALLGACVTLGRSFDAAQVKGLQVGKSTQVDVEKTFGAPFRTGLDSGDATWTYVDYHFGVFGPQRATDLLVKFNGDGTVKSYAFNTNAAEKN